MLSITCGSPPPFILFLCTVAQVFRHYSRSHPITRYCTYLLCLFGSAAGSGLVRGGAVEDLEAKMENTSADTVAVHIHFFFWIPFVEWSPPSVQFIGPSVSYQSISQFFSPPIIQARAPSILWAIALASVRSSYVPGSRSSCPSLGRHRSFSTVYSLLIKSLIALVDALALFNILFQPHNYFGFLRFQTPSSPLNMGAVNLWAR